MQKSSRIHQNLLMKDVPPIRVQTIHQKDLTGEIFENFLPPNSPRSLGIAGGYSASGNLVVLAIANEPTGVLIVQFHSKSKLGAQASVRASPRDLAGRQALQDNVLCRDGELYAFDLGPLTLSLYLGHNLYVSGGVDIQSAWPMTRPIRPIETIKAAIGDDSKVYDKNVLNTFNQPIFDPEQPTEAIQRAWISLYIASLSHLEVQFGKVPRINSKNFTGQQLHFLAKLGFDALRLDQKKPTSTTHAIKTAWDSNKDQVKASSNRFQNRIQSRSKYQTVQLQVGGSYTVPGQTALVKGKNAQIDVATSLNGKAITSITTEGREDPTTAEFQRNVAVLHILQGSLALIDDNPWIQNIWLFTDRLIWPPPFSLSSTTTSFSLDSSNFKQPINDSQLHAIEQMLSRTDDTRITLIQGPPGTGKTSVIATFVQAAISYGQEGIWLTAQSNIAVKNIAEKLLDYGFSNFKLLVSSDFHDEWHEHLYSKIPGKVIRSADFNKSRPTKDCQVLLCTLSMLSNPFLQASGFTTIVPVNTLVVDEASQIEIGDYIPVFNTFVQTIRKVCFIGDDKQLPPYGQEELKDLQSIFEVSHLRSSAILLNTQYRMPPQIGDFISDAVYDGQLLSNTTHPIKNSTTACYFIDANGQEKPHGTSFENYDECQAAQMIAAHLESQGKSYRIITPYDSQRTLIEQTLKEEGLSWQDKCFNVDSFQGNEDDYIILSLVRTRGLGFLKDLRRNNVMLTRCKRGMFICTHRGFLEDIAMESLAGRLMAYCGEEAWLEPEELEKI